MKDWKGYSDCCERKGYFHENDKECLFEVRQMQHPMMTSMQQEHQLYTATQVKTSLSSFNNKKYIKREGDEFETYSFLTLQDRK